MPRVDSVKKVTTRTYRRCFILSFSLRLIPRRTKKSSPGYLPLQNAEGVSLPVFLSAFPFLSAAVHCAVAAFSAERAAAAQNVFAPFAVSVADDALRPAVFVLDLRFVYRVAGALFPAGAQVFADLFLVARTAFPAASGISDPACDCRCWEEQGARVAEDR